MIWRRKDLARTVFGRRMFWILVAAFAAGKGLSALTGSTWPFWVLLGMGAIPFVFDIFKRLHEMTERDLERCGYPRSGDRTSSTSSTPTESVDTHEHH
jgi:hypothetical protein